MNNNSQKNTNKMLIKQAFVIILLLFLGCSTENEKSDAYGNFEAESIMVSGETQGKIREMNVTRGQKIDSGFICAVVDTLQLHLKADQTRAQKAAVKSKKETIEGQIAVLEQQKSNLEINRQRIEQMLRDSAATPRQFDDITGQIKVIEKQIASTKTQYIPVDREIDVLEKQQAVTGDMLRRCSITAPAAGTVLETYVEKGELTTPGKPLFKMAELSQLTLKAYISGAQLPSVQTGQEVKVIVDKSKTQNQTFTGTVTWISPEAEFTPKIIQTKEERVKLVYAIKVSVENDGTLKIGMPGEVVFSSIGSVENEEK